MMPPLPGDEPGRDPSHQASGAEDNPAMKAPSREEIDSPRPHPSRVELAHSITHRVLETVTVHSPRSQEKS